MKPSLWDAYDSYDREALQTAEMIQQLAGDILELYKAGVELNDPSPGAIQYGEAIRSSDLGDPTGNAATNPRRHQRATQLHNTRTALSKALKEIRHALYNSAAATAP